jgi:ribosomal protein S18 acetylase RimI-like enzyme
MEIVRGGPGDVEALAPLWLALREHQGSVTPEWGELRPADEGWGRRRKDFADILDEGGVLLLARDGEELVGFAVAEQEPWASPTWSWPGSILAIVEIVVEPGRRGGGIGAALMAELEQEARDRGVDALDLMVAGPNESARGFYERLGFRADLVTYRKPLG